MEGLKLNLVFVVARKLLNITTEQEELAFFLNFKII